MRFAVADSPAMTVEALLELLDDVQPRHFVDYGCGYGEVLLSVARRFPGLPCVGIELDPVVAAESARRIDGERLGNASVRLGDVFEHLDAAEDLAYLYLGGALNQRLGNGLMEKGSCRRVVTARYPVIGTVASARIPSGASPLYVYDRASGHGLVEWDSFATYLELPVGASYLLGRALRVTVASALELSVRLPGRRQVAVRGFEFGLVPARPGVPVICDVLLECDEDGGPGPAILELVVTASGGPLSPTHTVVVVPTRRSSPLERPIADAAELSRVLADCAGQS
ncbi:hypothetical protein PUR61_12330 [Streptomyces sp. BE20]|uniref:class I SAM-dependent methyltransferase n=1 Tax=unclassified Streptomyces TaxID=2593676 RepID=UPI002E78777C|nr:MULTISPECIES: hypothetical protein [unclassified Streptomyces]MED7948861.1 hypothetical protein [Streptomyces sp. BE303]MEE1822971.1 hypothetical protein [Streptomyces sp. BE20]